MQDIYQCSIWSLGHGRPCDNAYIIKCIENFDDCIRIIFAGIASIKEYNGESNYILAKDGECIIYNPSGFCKNANEIKIKNASRIKWKEYSASEPNILITEDFIYKDNKHIRKIIKTINKDTLYYDKKLKKGEYAFSLFGNVNKFKVKIVIEK